MFKVGDKVKLLRPSRGRRLSQGMVGTVLEIRNSTGNVAKDGVLVEFVVPSGSHNAEELGLGLPTEETFQSLFPFPTLSQSLGLVTGHEKPMPRSQHNKMTNREVYNLLAQLLRSGKGDEPFMIDTNKKRG